MIRAAVVAARLQVKQVGDVEVEGGGVADLHKAREADDPAGRECPELRFVPICFAHGGAVGAADGHFVTGVAQARERAARGFIVVVVAHVGQDAAHCFGREGARPHEHEKGERL